MSGWPSTFLSLLIGIAGWYYLFYSRAAHRLDTVETIAVNRRRIVLRRANGGTMILLAILLYVGSRAVDADRRPALFVAVWLSVLLLLLIVVILALFDLRLTIGLRNRK